MAEALHTKYRPKTWSEVCSQTTIVKILSKQIETNSFKNAYIFCGTSGAGKTSVARIFANEINKGQGHPIEIDAASHNGVEDIRNLISSANERAIDCTYKVIIIDEAHSISTQGWQAFLKCIEEPPPFTIFIFCSTEIQKIPETIKNRCQRYTFGRISTDKIKERLTYICQQEGFQNYTEGVEHIAKLANGGMRTAISYLDKCASFSKDITVANVRNTLELYQHTLFFRLIDHLMNKNVGGVLKAVDYFYNEGNDLKVFVDQFLNFVVDICKYSLFKNCDLTEIPNSAITELNEICSYEHISENLVTCMDTLLNLKNEIKNDTAPKTTIEVTFVLLCKQLI